VIHEVRITKIMNSLGEISKMTLKCGLNIRDTAKINQKKNQQCDLIEIESKIKEDSRLVKIAEASGKDKKIQRDLNSLAEQLRLGTKSPGTGTKTLFKDVKEARASSGARLYFREKNGKIEILAKSNKSPKDQKDAIRILRKKYG
jgi:hypothetical protein